MSQVDIMPKGLNWDWLNSEQDSLEFNWVGSLQRGGVSLLLDSWRKLPWGTGGTGEGLIASLRSVQVGASRLPEVDAAAGNS